MNQHDNCEANNQQSLIEDLTINDEQAAEVKGGPTVSGAVWSGVYDR